MFVRTPIYFSATDGGAAPAVVATVSPTPATPPATATDEPPAWAKALFAKVAAIEANENARAGAQARAEADKSAAEADKSAAEADKRTVEQRMAQVEEQLAASRIGEAIAKAVKPYRFAGEKAEAQALKLFRGDFRLEVRDGTVLAFGPDGKPQHVASAFAEWAKTEGGNYLAADVRPGAGAPPSSEPMARQPRAYKDLAPDEKRALLEQGIRGRLTNDAGAPVVELKRAPDPMLARRMEILGRIGAPTGVTRK